MVKENYNSDLYRTGDTSKYLKNFLYEGKFQLQSGDILDKLNIAYDGTHFHGWQSQPEKRTIQTEIEKSLSKIFNNKEY